MALAGCASFCENTEKQGQANQMRLFRALIVLVLALGLVACGDSKFRTYNGPKITEVQVHKADRKLYLISQDRVLKSYEIALGFAPVGHKQFEGDGKTPEGAYVINYKNPKSQYHLSLAISYPNEADIAVAEAQGKDPGGEIVIHGGPTGPISQRDWTWGCIAVTDREMEVIYSMVEPGTPIYLMP